MDDLLNTEAEKTSEKLPEFRGYRVMARVCKENLWHCRKEDGFYEWEEGKRVPDQEKILQIAKDEGIGEHKKSEEVLRPFEEMAEKPKDLVNLFISQAQKEGWLSKEATELTFKLTRPEDIQFTQEGKGGLNFDQRYDNTEFPKNDEEKPSVTISDEAVKSRVELYSAYSKELGIELSQEQLVDLGVMVVATHEWSHSIEKALVTQYAQTCKSLPDFDEKEDGWPLTGLSSGVLYRQAKEISMPVLSNLEERDVGSMDTERFATGFEMEATRIYLEQQGLPTETAQSMVDKMRKERGERLKDFSQMRDSLGKTDLELLTLTCDLRDVLKKGKLDEFYIPALWSTIGYFGGYNREQLKVSIDKALEEGKDTAKVAEQLAEKRKQRIPAIPFPLSNS
ncbi:MAG: hypothetical protein Q8P10_00745 [bacterium]|nr:hypothetical protein [bacterium]